MRLDKTADCHCKGIFTGATLVSKIKKCFRYSATGFLKELTLMTATISSEYRGGHKATF